MTWTPSKGSSGGGEGHTHANKTTLDKFGESNGYPTFNGNIIGSGGSGGGDGHTHTNKTTLDKLGEVDGQLIFNGAPATVGEPVLIDNQWVGKTWTVVGDSISDKSDSSATVHYYDNIKLKLGFSSVVEHAQSGASLAKGINDNNIVYIIDRITNADLITVFAGTNDYSTSKQAGTIDNTDIKTIYGALHYICQRLITYHPASKHALFTPLRRADMWTASTGVIKAGRAPNSSTGLTVENIADIILEVGAYYSIPVLDLHRRGGIEPSNPEHATRYMPDKIHPNNAGHERISNVIAEFLKTL